MTTTKATTEHRLRLNREAFAAAARGERVAEHRWLADRPFAVGDLVVLEEWDERRGHQGPTALTGRTLRRRIIYIDVGGDFGIRHGYGLLHLAALDEEVRGPHGE